MRIPISLLSLACCVLATWACEPSETQNGCKIYGNSCKCSYGCASEYTYKTRRDCSKALKAIREAATAPPSQTQRWREAATPPQPQPRTARAPQPQRWRDPVTAAQPQPQRWRDPVTAAQPQPQRWRDPPTAAQPQPQRWRDPVSAVQPQPQHWRDPVTTPPQRWHEAATPPPPQQQRSPNICSQVPCLRGYCLQTASNETGFTCKCEGTGFYGRHCEKACPTSPVNEAVFPHECVVI